MIIILVGCNNIWTYLPQNKLTIIGWNAEYGVRLYNTRISRNLQAEYCLTLFILIRFDGQFYVELWRPSVKRHGRVEVVIVT